MNTWKIMADDAEPSEECHGTTILSRGGTSVPISHILSTEIKLNWVKCVIKPNANLVISRGRIMNEKP